MKLLSLALSIMGAARTLQAAPVDTPANFSATSGTKFVIDGKTGYFAGSNMYWIGFMTSNSDVDSVLDHFAASGFRILRVWGFNDVTRQPGAGTVYFQYLSASGSTINTGANGLQRLDYVVAGAEKRGVKLVVNFVNNWSDYGGMPAYVTAFGGTKEGWYNNTRAQTQYRAYVTAVVNRYRNSSALFAWELANEPRCHGCSTDVLYNWASDVSKYIKSLDPNHLVTLGDEGFGLPGGTSSTSYPYGTSEGVDFARNLKIPTLDYGTFHMYPEGWGVTNAFAPDWIKDHAAACKAAGKPCVLEEYGVANSHCTIEKPWQQTSMSLANDGMAADMFWQWGDKLPSGQQTPNDGNTVYYGTTDGQCLITDHGKAVASLSS